MLQDIGADHAVEASLRRARKRLVGRVVADDALDAPIFLHAVPALDALLGEPYGAVLSALAAAVVEEGARVRLQHQPAYVVRLGQQAAAGKRVLGSDAAHELAAYVHLAVELEQAPVTRAWIAPAVREQLLRHRRGF
ncbi:MAG: hypothetical protein E6H70_00155 [Betaproteobacteria bacterium]|nr:MAG: hypothetical protein E6H70_00155 [Betaproteobacteria bacterium]